MLGLEPLPGLTPDVSTFFTTVYLRRAREQNLSLSTDPLTMG